MMRFLPASYALGAVLLPMLLSSAAIAQELPPLPLPEPEVVAEPQAPTAVPSAESLPLAETAADTGSDAVPQDGDATPPSALPARSLRPLPWEGSLMFPQQRVDELTAIYEAYLARLRGETGEDGIASNVAEETLRLLTADEDEKVDEEIYNFSLNSILYDHAARWSIWVNGKRYSREEAMGGFTVNTSNIRVVQASDNAITFVWEPDRRAFPFVYKRWEAKRMMEKQSSDPQEAAGAAVDMDETGKQVSVTLRPNQTFLSQFMTVMEGKATPRGAAASMAEAGAEDEGAQAGADGGAGMDTGTGNAPLVGEVMPMPPAEMQVPEEILGQEEMLQNPGAPATGLQEVAPTPAQIN